MTAAARPALPTGAVRPARAAVRLCAALAVLLGCTLGIGYLLTRADEGDAFERIDRALVRWFVDHRTATLDALSRPAAELGNTGVVVGLAAAAAAATFWAHRSWRPAVLLMVALCGEFAVFLATTAVIDRPRPPVAHLDADLPPTSSFPSGHTAAAVCLYGVLAALLLARVPRRRRGVRAVVLTGAVAVVAVVAAARLYRGAHYPTDVLTSVLFAVPWLMVTLATVGLRRPPADQEWESGDVTESNSPARRAVLHTNHGDITVDLFPDHAPKTVANFADLAEGRREWTHPQTRQKTTDRLYDGTIFHRIISGFMIQGGDPLGQGIGGPGYQFGDEFHPELSFDRPYLLAMANAGPGTNGSQFFITVGPTPHLNRKHSIFGEVTDQSSREVVDRIATVATGRNDRPVEDVVIESVEVQRS